MESSKKQSCSCFSFFSKKPVKRQDKSTDTNPVLRSSLIAFPPSFCHQEENPQTESSLGLTQKLASKFPMSSLIEEKKCSTPQMYKFPSEVVHNRESSLKPQMTFYNNPEFLSSLKRRGSMPSIDCMGLRKEGNDEFIKNNDQKSFRENALVEDKGKEERKIVKGQSFEKDRKENVVSTETSFLGHCPEGYGTAVWLTGNEKLKENRGIVENDKNLVSFCGDNAGFKEEKMGSIEKTEEFIGIKRMCHGEMKMEVMGEMGGFGEETKKRGSELGEEIKKLDERRNSKSIDLKTCADHSELFHQPHKSEDIPIKLPVNEQYPGEKLMQKSNYQRMLRPNLNFALMLKLEPKAIPENPASLAEHHNKLTLNSTENQPISEIKPPAPEEIKNLPEELPKKIQETVSFLPNPVTEGKNFNSTLTIPEKQLLTNTKTISEHSSEIPVLKIQSSTKKSINHIPASLNLKEIHSKLECASSKIAQIDPFPIKSLSSPSLVPMSKAEVPFIKMELITENAEFNSESGESNNSKKTSSNGIPKPTENQNKDNKATLHPLISPRFLSNSPSKTNFKPLFAGENSPHSARGLRSIHQKLAIPALCLSQFFIEPQLFLKESAKKSFNQLIEKATADKKIVEQAPIIEKIPECSSFSHSKSLSQINSVLVHESLSFSKLNLLQGELESRVYEKNEEDYMLNSNDNPINSFEDHEKVSVSPKYFAKRLPSLKISPIKSIMSADDYSDIISFLKNSPNASIASRKLSIPHAKNTGKKAKLPCLKPITPHYLNKKRSAPQLKTRAKMLIENL